MEVLPLPKVQPDSPASAPGSKRPRPESEPSTDLYFGATANELILALPYVYNPELISVDGLTFRDDKDEDDRFLRQVRQSKGYDVDSFPSEEWNSPYGPIFEPERSRVAIDAANYAIAKINEHTKKNYSIIGVSKAVASRTYTVFLTFNAIEYDGRDPEDIGEDEVVDVVSFRAMVAWDSKPEKMELMEYWTFLQDGSWGGLQVLNGKVVLPNGCNAIFS